MNSSFQTKPPSQRTQGRTQGQNTVLKGLSLQYLLEPWGLRRRPISKGRFHSAWTVAMETEGPYLAGSMGEGVMSLFES